MALRWSLTMAVALSLTGTAAFPKVADCGAAQFFETQQLFIDYVERHDEAVLHLNPDEGAFLTITRKPSRRSLNSLRLLCDQSKDGGDCQWEDDDVDIDALIEQLDDDDDDLGAQPLGDDDDGFFRVVQFQVRIKDEFSNVVSEKSSIFFDDEGALGNVVYLQARGQQGGCAHPSRMELRTDRGFGIFNVTSTVLKRREWNAAALSFADAADVGSPDSKTNWCGNVNLLRTDSYLPIEDPHTSCPRNSNTPKWKVWLNPSDELLVTARLQGRDGIDKDLATKVELKLYRSPNLESAETAIVRSRVVGRKTKRGFFINKEDSASWFYLELSPSKRHLYGYAIAFKVKRSCSDVHEGTFVLPKDDKTCSWLAAQPLDRKQSICGSSSKSDADINCRVTCSRCTDCFEPPDTRFHLREHTCKYLQKKMNKLEAEGKFEEYCGSSVAGDVCPETCGKCPAIAGPAM